MFLSWKKYSTIYADYPKLCGPSFRRLFLYSMEQKIHQCDMVFSFRENVASRLVDFVDMLERLQHTQVHSKQSGLLHGQVMKCQNVVLI